MRYPKLPVLLGTATVWLGSVGWLLDLVGRWDAAMHIKALLPSVLGSPFISPIILAIGFLVLFLNTRKPLIVAAVLDAHGNAYERPGHPVIRYGLYAIAAAAGCVVAFVAAWTYTHPPNISLSPPPMVPVDKSSLLGTGTKISKRTVSVRREGETVCTPKKGKFYSDYTLLPGGPKLERPMLVLSMGTFPFVMVEVKGTYLLAFELVISNRGGGEHREELGTLLST
jgi:hypothetical protein